MDYRNPALSNASNNRINRFVGRFLSSEFVAEYSSESINAGGYSRNWIRKSVNNPLTGIVAYNYNPCIG